jgi:hypothetical protein
MRKPLGGFSMTAVPKERRELMNGHLSDLSAADRLRAEVSEAEATGYIGIDASREFLDRLEAELRKRHQSHHASS